MRVGGGGVNQNQILEKTDTFLFIIIVLLQADIRNTFFDQKSPQHSEVGVLCLRA